MKQQELIPHLFRSEYSKITAVLCRIFGFSNIQVAEDIVSDAFLLAAETWGAKGIPPNPEAWLYTVSKNKATDYLRRNQHFEKKIKDEYKRIIDNKVALKIDLSEEHIEDSQLQMLFVICNPYISVEAQIGLALRILCGFGIDEIASAFLAPKETINKRLFRAKEKLREEQLDLELPSKKESSVRLNSVTSTLYLLFNEGYYSKSHPNTLRKDLCLEAMRLTLLLSQNAQTSTTKVNALLSLMCFHASRLEARIDQNGEFVLYEDQNTSLWDQGLIEKGEYYLSQSAQGTEASKYHLEAAIAYWHTRKEVSTEKWQKILQLYNQLLQIEYSPITALNRTYALAKADGKLVAIKEAEKIQLKDSHLYHCLLADLYTDIDKLKVISHLETALKLAKTSTDKALIIKKIAMKEG